MNPALGLPLFTVVVTAPAVADVQMAPTVVDVAVVTYTGAIPGASSMTIHAPAVICAEVGAHSATPRTSDKSMAFESNEVTTLELTAICARTEPFDPPDNSLNENVGVEVRPEPGLSNCAEEIAPLAFTTTLAITPPALAAQV
jgi:hypothetical protein